ncbi:dipeptidase [Williamsia sterculiae]|uniref:Acetylornithine deacetylase/Succinyl-diaminopimelate desuccinylase n=1 Tax=Williamsia sterculiae TaxID=1344003 RepID=A0A1N7F093_9NOCA|nr:dipeptidase [Williamsia sterculiae]SIR93605.1 Acetylornithine deacetylase/Succinyl-diaminopimelate desuccinylase [Williamsia sterculiae]
MPDSTPDTGVTDTQTLRDRVRTLMTQAQDDLGTMVAFRTVFGVPELADDCRRSADWVATAFTDAGVPSEVLDTADGSFAVFGRREAPAGDSPVPTVLLYSHHDVQPAGPDADWHSPAFELTERDGRWYGRGAADCKGNVVAHLTALRALGDDIPCTVKVVVEGSEEAGGEGLEHLVRDRPELFAADVIVIADAGNVEVGTPTLTTNLRGVANLDVTVETLGTEVHSGQFGGAAPDALAALVAGLASLRDEQGNTTIDGLRTDQVWTGAPYSSDRFRGDAGVLDGVDLLGSGTPADMTWARPSVTVIGLDAPPTDDCAAAIRPRASAVLNLRVPAGVDAEEARDLLADHLRAHIPWRARVTFGTEMTGQPFAARLDGPFYQVLSSALARAYDAAVVHSGQGGSIPLAGVLMDIAPAAEIALLGVEEPSCRIHAPDESVDPGEIERTALAEAIFIDSLRAR